MTVTVIYYAMLREQAGLREESVETGATTPSELYRELQARHGFELPSDRLKVAINDELAGWEDAMAENQTIAFIPPVAGG